MESLESRVLKIELTTDLHTKEIETIRNEAKVLESSLKAIEKSLQQIKWLAVGSVCGLLAQSLGLDKILRLFL